MKCLAWLTNVMKEKKAIEGKKHKEQEKHVLKLWTHVRIESTITEEKDLRMWKAAGWRNSPYKVLCT